MKFCAGGGNCVGSEASCKECSTHWIDPSAVEPGCNARLDPCTSDDQCCGDTMVCLELPVPDPVYNANSLTYMGYDIPTCW